MTNQLLAGVFWMLAGAHLGFKYSHLRPQGVYSEYFILFAAFLAGQAARAAIDIIELLGITFSDLFLAAAAAVIIVDIAPYVPLAYKKMKSAPTEIVKHVPPHRRNVVDDKRK